jgi:hypothetical protein
MEYFRIEENRKGMSRPEFKMSSLPRNAKSKGQAFCKSTTSDGKMNYMTLPFMEKRATIEFAFIISKGLKKIFSAYQEGGEYFPFFTADIAGRGLPYYVFVPLVLECLSEETKFGIRKNIEKLVLNPNKIGNNKVFQVNTAIGHYLIVELEILELMLYNGEYPFTYTPVLLSTEEE